MSDNVQLPVTGTGTADIVAATDDVASVHYPFVKLADGTLGGTEPIAGTTANGLDVDVTRVSGNVTVVQATAANLNVTEASAAAIAASASVLDDWDESDRAKVNPIVGQAGIAAGTGVDGATVPRVTLATNVPLPTGTNSIGQVTANAGTNLNTSALALETGGNLAGAATSLAILDDWDESDRAKVNLIVGQAGVTAGAGNTDAATQRVVIATNQAAVPVLDTNSAAALTALQVIDDTIKVDDAAFTVGTTSVTMAGIVAVAHGSAPDAADALDAVAPIANRHRVQWVIGGHPNARTSVYNTTASGTDDNIMPTISGGTKYAVTQIMVTLDQACTVGVAVRIGFGTANVPALGASQADAVEGVILYHPGMVPGSIFSRGDGSGVLGVGGDGEELRITNGAPTTGTLGVVVTWYPIES